MNCDRRFFAAGQARSAGPQRIGRFTRNSPNFRRGHPWRRRYGWERGRRPRASRPLAGATRRSGCCCGRGFRSGPRRGRGGHSSAMDHQVVTAASRGLRRREHQPGESNNCPGANASGHRAFSKRGCHNRKPHGGESRGKDTIMNKGCRIGTQAKTTCNVHIASLETVVRSIGKGSGPCGSPTPCPE
jgi:hypothetical protein